MNFELLASSASARRGRLTTSHGIIDTPFFMPIATAGAIKGMDFNDVRTAGAEIILGNTYHLHLTPGDELIKSAGGLHRFIGWDGPILTDSGGFQVYSLAKTRKITEEGVNFQSHIDGRKIMLTPEKAIEIQHNLGSDIIMVLDECKEQDGKVSVKESMDMTTRWAERCLNHHQKLSASSNSTIQQLSNATIAPALFAIVQGSTYPDLRAKHAHQLTKMNFDGYALGGLAVGESEQDMYSMVEATVPHLPSDQPRYLMGVGTPVNLIEAIARGIDMFDCVLPSRNARHGTLYTSEGVVNIRLEKMKSDFSPIDPNCDCPTCLNHTRAYLRHLLKAGEIMAMCHLVTHNIWYYLNLMRKIRKSIEEDNFEKLRKEIHKTYGRE